MPKDSVTLEMKGEPTLADFARVMGGLVDLLDGLGEAVAQGATIEWVIDNLETGSAIATIRGFVNGESGGIAVEETVEAYEQVGIALQSRQPIPFPSVQGATTRMVAVLNGRVTSLVFRTDDVDAEVGTFDAAHHHRRAREVDSPKNSFGTVRGRMQAMSNRRGNRFTLWELGTERGIACYYADEMEPKVVAAYGKVAIVEGWIRRNPNTGDALAVRGVTEIEAYPTVDRQAYRMARGAMPESSSNMSSEAAVRKVRDA